jgi:phosphoribosyl 1,2-cyclic phosphodiesterase
LLEVVSLGSGSCGNAFLVRTPGIVLLVDCGVGVRGMSRTLATFGLHLSDIDALLISHEHSDHVRELPRFTAMDRPILSTNGTAAAARIPRHLWAETHPRKPVSIADVEIHAIPVSHDAAEPCGFLIRSAAGAVTVLTDLGCSSPCAEEAIVESRLVVLEANHDEAMLRRGRYPVHLQRRILSDAGHLSNDACARLLASALPRSHLLPTIWLAHLSESNNTPALATKTVTRQLAETGLRLDVQALPRKKASATWSAAGAKPGAAQLQLDWELSTNPAEDSRFLRRIPPLPSQRAGYPLGGGQGGEGPLRHDPGIAQP